MKILAIEDNKILDDLYTMMFKKLEISFCLAKTGEGALRLYREMHFDLILSDFYLSDMDGFELLRGIRALEKKTTRKRVPIIIVSASMKETLGNGHPADFDDWLMKPLTEEALKKILEKYFYELHLGGGSNETIT